MGAAQPGRRRAGGLDLDGRPGLREPIEEVLGEELDDGYAAEVVAIPAVVQFRPARVTPTPRITGMESAVIDGAVEDIYAQLDDHGRYNVRFKFDESDLEDGRASTRLRMVQPHGGADEGFHFPVRKGTEVMVSFVGGDPDRPIITGVSPNAHKPSVVTRGNATQNVLKTGGGNKLVMEDTKDKQWINASSPHQNSFLHLGEGSKNFELSTDGCGMIRTGANLETEVGGGRHDHVKLDMVERFDALQDTEAKSRKETVHGTVTETYEGHYEQKVTTGGTVREVTGHATETFNTGLLHTVESGLEQHVNGGLHQIINNGAVKVDAVGGQLIIDAEAGILLKSKGPILQKGETSVISHTPAKIEIADLKGTISKSTVFTVTPHTASIVVGAATNYFTTKSEFHGMKVDFTVCNIHNKPIDVVIGEAAMKSIKLKIATGALLLQLARFTLIG